MRAFVALAAFLSALFAASAGSRAQPTPSIPVNPVIHDDPAGFPIRIVPLDLTAGVRYDIRTDYFLQGFLFLPPPDAVLALRDPRGDWVAGANTCPIDPDGPSTRPACFSYTAARSGVHSLYVYARATNTPGQTRLHYRESAPVLACDDDSDCPTGSSCGADEECWSPVIEGYTVFGGATVATALPRGAPGDRRFFMSTVHRPGESTDHLILTTAFTQPGTVTRSAFRNGRVGDTAMIDVPDRLPAGLVGFRRHVYGTPFVDQMGAVRLIRNRWYAAGEDADQDGLSLDLEQALGTCDRTTQPVLPSGFRCSDIEECRLMGASSDDCQDALRDSDHDGIRDDLEVFGYDHPLLHIARWGADPAHYDVFVEVDASDQVETDTDANNIPEPTDDGDLDDDPCNSFNPVAPAGIGGPDDFFARTAEMYAGFPAARNPDGRPGIALHYDIGIANPDPEDTRWGDWGHGGTCLPSTCGESQAYNNAGGSTCPPTPFADARKWLFVYSVDFTARNGQTTTDRVAYGATSIIGHVHELGHVGRLEHGGPHSSAGAASEIDSNYRPNYPSRISYMFQNVGGFDRSPGRPVWQSVSFSSGAWAAPWSSRGISEECPLSTGTSLGVLNEVGERATQDSRCVPGSWSVDWDHSGIIEPGLRPMARIYDNYRIRRQVEIVDARALRASGSAAVIGERGVTGRAALVYADVSLRDDAGRAFIELRADGEGDCSEYPRPPTAVRDAGYPPCFDHGAPIAIGFDATIEGLAVAITSAPVMVDGSLREGAVMVWHDPLDQLRWATFTVRSDARADEEIELADYQDHGVTHINETVFGAIGSLEPALVRVSGIDGDPRTDEVVLAWRHGDGTRVRYASLEPGATGWSEARTAVDETGPLLVATAVSLASEGRNVWLAAAPVFGGGLVIHRRRAVLDEGFEWPLELRYEHPAACTTVRPALVRAPSIRDEDRTHHWLLWRGCDSFLWMAFDDFHADPLTPGSPPDPYASPQGFRPFHGSSDVMPVVGPVAVWDDRDTLPHRLHGLRVYRTHPAACRFDGECLTAPATSCLNGQCVDPDEPATSYGVVTLSPFGRGPEPGYHTDYDDWTGLRWGLCMAREHGTRVVPDFPPERTDDYVRRSYRTVRCGPAPHYLEPSAGGMAITSPGLDDRDEHPWLYEPPGPVECLVQ